MVNIRYTRLSDQDLVIPASLLLAAALILPPLQGQAWWLLLPCLFCLVLRWRMPALVLMLGASLYADSWFAGAYFLILLVLLLARFTTHTQHSLRWACLHLLQAVPLLLVLALLVAGAGDRFSRSTLSERSGTGISERMAPGSVSELAANTDLAMRVRFEDGVSLPPDQLYWRGIVMENYNGRFWSRALPLEFVTDSATAEGDVRYQVALEPNRQIWLFALHQARTDNPQIYLDSRDVLVSATPLIQRIRYTVTSTLQPEPELELSADVRQRNLALPPDSNPQTRAWIAALQTRFPDARDLTQALLSHFGQEAFYYTFTPPATGEQFVDDFLFTTRQGFCEHYAAALAFSLRAAGIPARVVTGYQGGQYNPVSGHWSVYQYNAHAWVEAWYPESGWVQLDPTRYIAPERIDAGMDAWLATVAPAQLDTRARLRLQLAGIPGVTPAMDVLDAMAYLWNQNVFDDNGDLRTEQINQWLEQRGLANAPLWLMALLLFAVGLRAMTGTATVSTRRDAALKPYRQFDARLRKLGLGRQPEETIQKHLQRVARACPRESDQLLALAQQVSGSVYGPVDPENSEMPAAGIYKLLYRAIRESCRA